jgi:hypothetical protein
MGYIYIIREREFIKCNEQIYKIGKTGGDCPNKRLCSYPKGSELIYTCFNNNPDQTEKDIKIKFKENYIQRTDIGIEYFEGDLKHMIGQIHIIVLNNMKDEVEVKSEQKEIKDELKEIQPITTVNELYKYLDNQDSGIDEIFLLDREGIEVYVSTGSGDGGFCPGKPIEEWLRELLKETIVDYDKLKKDIMKKFLIDEEKMRQQLVVELE